MGLPFKEIVSGQELPWESLAGRTLAVDAYNAIYQFLATIRQRDGHPFTDADGSPTSHLIGVLYRTTALLESGVLPVFVFDGKPPDLKAGTIRERLLVKEKAEAAWDDALARGDLEAARKQASRTSHLTRPMVEETKELLAALGVPVVQAPSEGEAQAAVMASRSVVWAAASEDYDSLLFGAPRLVRGLAARGSRPGSGTGAQLVVKDDLLKELGVSDEELLLIGLLVGTDFNDGAAGIGPKRALKLVRRHLGWAATLKEAGLDPVELEPVAELFRRPPSVDTGPVAFGPISDDAVERLLVGHHNFSEERVRGAIARARRRPSNPVPPPTVRGRQASLDGFGG